MLRPQKHHLNAVYRKATQMIISDDTSRLALPHSWIWIVQKERIYYDVYTVNTVEELMKEIEAIDANAFHNMTDETLQKVALATSQDDSQRL